MGLKLPRASIVWLAVFGSLSCTDAGEPDAAGGRAGASPLAGSAGSDGGRGGAAGGGGRAGSTASGGRAGSAGSTASGGAGTGSGGAAGSRATGGASGNTAEAGSAGELGAAGEPAANGGAGGESAAGGTAGTAPGSYWQPMAGPLSWQWQLSEELDTPLTVSVYDIDWEAPASDVERLHAQDTFVICYVSVGSWEDFRPDADDFPDEVIGNDYDGWPGEKYVDIRAPALREIMLARFDTCQDKGFDAIEPDNMDVFELGADSGFPLTRADGIAYARFLADAAHARGLGIGQKNAASISADIQADYQWALTESCYSDGGWCDDVADYVLADKPVFMCEYEASSFDDACSYAAARRYSPILKNLDLDAEVTFCP